MKSVLTILPLLVVLLVGASDACAEEYWFTGLYESLSDSVSFALVEGDLTWKCYGQDFLAVGLLTFEPDSAGLEATGTCRTKTIGADGKESIGAPRPVSGFVAHSAPNSKGQIAAFFIVTIDRDGGRYSLFSGMLDHSGALENPRGRKE